MTKNRLNAVICVLLAMVALTALGRALIPASAVRGDFITFYAGASLIAAGASPYDPAAQAEVSRELGWDKARDGAGIYDFMPYYYPAWLAIAFMPFLLLEFETANIVWLVLNAELMLLSGLLLRGLLKGVSPAGTVFFVCFFGLSVLVVLMGQLAPLMFFVIVLGWKLLQEERDFLAGVVLAFAVTKPQLSAVLLVGVALWSLRQGRWQVSAGMAASVAGLSAICTVASPGWLAEMIAAPSVTPMPIEHFPSAGTTWFVILKTTQLSAPLLWAGYLVVAIPFIVAVTSCALDRKTRLEDVVGLSLIAAFFVAPYARSYDFPVLVIPALMLVGTRLREMPGAALLISLLVLPYLHWGIMRNVQGSEHWPSGLNPEFLFFWIPALIACVWWKTRPGAVNVAAAPPLEAQVSCLASAAH